jgi:hypothetical protein
MPTLKRDSSIRKGKPGRSRMHPAGVTETPVRSSGLLSSNSKPVARPRRTVGTHVKK